MEDLAEKFVKAVLVDPILGDSVNSPPSLEPILVVGYIALPIVEPILVVGLVDVHWGCDLAFDPWPPMHVHNMGNVDPVLVCNPPPLEGWKVLGGQDFGRFFALPP